MRPTPYIRNSLIATPLVGATLLPFVFLAAELGIVFSWRLVGLGALGWWLALLARGPVILLARKLPTERARTLIIGASGPAEELVRVGLLVLIGRGLDSAYMLGLGWAVIEIVYSLIQGFALGALAQKTDKKAREAKALLEQQGMHKSLEPAAPYWGIVERLSANATHIGFSLLLVVSPWLVVVTAPLHSSLNLMMTRLFKRSMALAEVAFLAVSTALFGVSLLLVS